MNIQPDLQLAFTKLGEFSPSDATTEKDRIPSLVYLTLKSKVTALIEDQGPSSFRDLCTRNITFKNFSELTQDEITKIRTEKGDCIKKTYSKFCKDKIPEKVEHLLRNAAYIYFSNDPSFTDSDRQNFSRKSIESLLHTSKDPKQVHSLLQLDCNPNITDSWGYTPLHLAAKSGRAEIARLLINKNANVNARNNKGHTPLHLAASGKSKGESIKPLIDAGADLHAEDDKGNTPLHMAVYAPRHIRMAIATTLIEEGANVDTPNYEGNTPLHSAVESGHIEIASLLITSLLINKNANVNLKNNKGHTPLHLAAWGELGERLIQALIDAGADPHIKDNKEQTPLHMTVSGPTNGQVERASILIGAGADLHAKDNKDNTPLMYAKELSNELFKQTGEQDLSIVELLRKG